MWTFALARLAGILLAGLVVGLVARPVWAMGLLGFACFYMGWQLLNLYRLDRWLRLRSQIDPPNLGGIWGDVIAQVVRLHRRKQYHKQRLVQLFRELRRSTAALPDGVIILSSQSDIVWFNRQAARLLGLKRPVDIGLRIDNSDPHAGVRPLPARRGLRDAARDPAAGAARVVPRAAARALRRRPIPAAGARTSPGRCASKPCARISSPTPRTSCGRPLTVISGYLDTLAGRSFGRRRLGGTHQGHARAGAAHERHHRGSARAVAARIGGRRGAARADRSAAPARAPAPRCLGAGRAAAARSCSSSTRPTACSARPTKSSRRSPICWSTP